MPAASWLIWTANPKQNIFAASFHGQGDKCKATLSQNSLAEKTIRASRQHSSLESRLPHWAEAASISPMVCLMHRHRFIKVETDAYKSRPGEHSAMISLNTSDDPKENEVQNIG